MGEASSRSDSDQDNAQGRIRYAYTLLEVMAAIVFVGALLWLLLRYPFHDSIARALLNVRLWILVLLVSGWGTAGALVPYYLGRRGTKAVFEHYPRLEGQPWERLGAIFQRWGAFSLVLSGIPIVGGALLVAAGAFDIRRWPFLYWSFVGKVLRNWVLAFVVLSSLELLG
jgi:membrane protein YqaA with SNARE-associated domain